MITDKQAAAAKPQKKTYMIRDDYGLYLRVTPTGRKYWIIRQWYKGKESQKSLGAYPLISLKEARRIRDEMRLARTKYGDSGINAPSATFAEVAEDWKKIKLSELAAGSQKSVLVRLDKYILPHIGNKIISNIHASDLLPLLRRIEDSGYIETAKRVRVIIGQIIRYAISCGLANDDPTAALKGALRTPKKSHYAAPTTIDGIRGIVRLIQSYQYVIVRNLLLWQIFTAARPGEARRAEWCEINNDVWTIPAEKMKMHRPHIVPLPTAARKILDEMRPLTGNGRYIFPSPRSSARPMSDNTARIALRTMGVAADIATPHGFRAAFSSVCNSAGKNPDVIEACLAHIDSNAVRAAYNRADYMDKRRELLEWYAGMISKDD